MADYIGSTSCLYQMWINVRASNVSVRSWEAKSIEETLSCTCIQQPNQFSIDSCLRELRRVRLCSRVNIHTWASSQSFCRAWISTEPSTSFVFGLFQHSDPLGWKQNIRSQLHQENVTIFRSVKDVNKLMCSVIDLGRGIIHHRTFLTC